MLPILYSFRRCPYAIRARMALHYAGVQVEMREVLLKDKPPSMLAASSKGTVPVLIFPDGQVLDESYDVMRWALEQSDPEHWWVDELETEVEQLIQWNDGEFKSHLDHYKYFERYLSTESPEHPMEYYRSQAEEFLMALEQRLSIEKYLLGKTISVADVAIFPFIRQFAFADKNWFDLSPYSNLQSWLTSFLDSDLFVSVMTKHPVWSEPL